MDKKMRWFLFILFVLLLLPLAFMRCWRGVSFWGNDVEWVKGYWGFIWNILALILGFYLVNVLWGQREKREKRRQSRQQILEFLLQLNLVLSNISRLLERSFSSDQTDENQKRDMLVGRYLDQARALSVSAGSFPMTVEDDAILHSVRVTIVSKIVVDIENLPDSDTFRLDFDGFQDLLSQLRQSIGEGLRILYPDGYNNNAGRIS